jgi:hypothetical protein
VVRVHAGPRKIVVSREYLVFEKKDSRLRTKDSRLEKGGLAQLARAPALQAGGHRFDSDILHKGVVSIETLDLRLRDSEEKSN